MKNSNYQQDMKFNNQVNHLQSFIGMSMWNGRNPSLSEIREYDRQLLEKQALGFEPKRKSSLKLLISSMMTIVSTASNQIAKAGKKSSEITSELKAPIKTATECCG